MKGDVGEPIMATDPDNDALLYSLADSTDLENDDEEARFKIDEDSGQLEIVDGLDWETAVGEADEDEYTGC